MPRKDAERSLPGLPAWADARVQQISGLEADLLATSGVRVIGDPAALVVGPGDHPEQLPPDPDQVPVEVAVEALTSAFGALVADHDHDRGVQPGADLGGRRRRRAGPRSGAGGSGAARGDGPRPA